MKKITCKPQWYKSICCHMRTTASVFLPGTIRRRTFQGLFPNTWTKVYCNSKQLYPGLTPCYKSTDPNKIPDLLDIIYSMRHFLVLHETWIQLLFVLRPSPIPGIGSSLVIHTNTPVRLHNNRASWEEYRTEIHENINTCKTSKTQQKLTWLTSLIKTSNQICHIKNRKSNY